jgi:hypothetical protein
MQKFVTLARKNFLSNVSVDGPKKAKSKARVKK